MSLLMIMSITGSVVVLVYILLEKIAKKHFTAVWLRSLLQIAIFFYLIPFPLFKFYYRDILTRFLPVEGIRLHMHSVVAGKAADVAVELEKVNNFIVFSQKGIKYISNSIVFSIIVLLALAVIIVTNVRFRQYCLVKRKLYVEIKFLAEGNEYDLMKDLASDMRLKRKIRIGYSRDIGTPLTMGIIRPIVLLPDRQYSASALAAVIRHELQHIKSNDLLFNFLTISILALNFWNPCAYYLYKKWPKIIELACDEKVLAKIPREHYRSYGIAILESMVGHPLSDPITTGLNKSEERVKERITRVTEFKKKHWINRILGTAVLAAVTFTTSLTALAYEPTNEYYINNEEGSTWTEAGSLTFCDGDFLVAGEEATALANEALVTGGGEQVIFINENGEVFTVDKDTSEYALCNHTYSDGTAIEHFPNGSGGCTSYYYKAKRCTKCGTIIRGEFMNKMTLTVCVH